MSTSSSKLQSYRYFGYTRCSTKDQDVGRGLDEIKNWCKCQNIAIDDRDIYSDKKTGKNFDRPSYQKLKGILEVLSEEHERIVTKGGVTDGLCLIVPELDRLGRSDETLTELQWFKERNIKVIFLDIPTTQMNFEEFGNDMAQAMLKLVNDLLIQIFSSMAKSELDRKQKRQREGYEQLKKRGEWDKLGRPHAMNFADFKKAYKKVESGQCTTTELMRELKMSESTYYRYQKQYMNENHKE